MRRNKRPPVKQATRRYKRRRAELLAPAVDTGLNPVFDRVDRKPRPPGVKEIP